MVKPYRIGKHKVTQEDFDKEVLRLYKLGLEMGQIALRLRRERTTIWRALKRVQSGLPEEIEKAKEQRQYYRETQDEFRNEGIIKEWVEDMKARRVGDRNSQVSHIKAICDDLQIFPDQLDLDWGKKWLASKVDVDLDKLRGRKVAARSFFKAQGVNDYDLTQAGFDAKHYGVGKWKHVKLTKEQISFLDGYLGDYGRFPRPGQKEAHFCFKFGLETCRTLEPIWNLKGDQFYTLEVPGKTLYACNLFRKKTEKSGAAYKTAYCSKSTYELAKELSSKNGGTIMNGFKPEQIYAILRDAYKAAGVSIEYFDMHPIHALRHSGAQRLLEKTNFNRAVTAELGGWEAEKTLEDHYGGVPIDVIRAVAADVL